MPPRPTSKRCRRSGLSDEKEATDSTWYKSRWWTTEPISGLRPLVG
jgi:hypothetical protein